MSFLKMNNRIPQRLVNILLLMAIGAFLISSNQKDDHIKNSKLTGSMQPYLGEVAIFPYNFEPRYWMKCEGQILQISQHTDLFSILGTMYGGDGRVTFALPDMRGRALVGSGNGTGVTPRSLGQKGGGETTSLNTAQLPVTQVNLTSRLAVKYDSSKVEPAGASGTAANVIEYLGGGSGEATITGPVNIPSLGGGQAINNMQPYTTLGYYICIDGQFPPIN
jgi:microcystin-dependent protein